MLDTDEVSDYPRHELFDKEMYIYDPKCICYLCMTAPQRKVDNDRIRELDAKYPG